MNNTGADDMVSPILQQVQNCLVVVIIIFGLMGNCACLVMFLSRRYRYRSSSQYLLVLAISDIGYLLTIALLPAQFYHLDWAYSLYALVPFHYLSSVCSHLSSLYILAFTVERFVAVFWPLKCMSLCTVSRARSIIAAATVIAVLFNIWVPVDIAKRFALHQELEETNEFLDVDYTNDSAINSDYSSDVDEPQDEVYEVMTLVDTIVTLIIPGALIVTFDLLIGIKLIKLTQQRKTLTSGGKLDNIELLVVKTSNFSRNPAVRKRLAPQQQQGSDTNLSQSSRKSWRMTKVMLAVATTYLILNFPSYILRLVTGWLTDTQLEIFRSVAYLMFYSQFGINFILYSTNLQHLRKNCCHCHRNRAGPDSVVSTYL